jgi:uncharacterized protein (TIGR03435 family)
MIPEYLSPFANHLWQSTLVTGVAALLKLLLRKNEARVRFWIWFIAAIKFLIPFSLLVSIGQQFEWRTPPVVAQRPMMTVTQLSAPFDQTLTGQDRPSTPPLPAPKASAIPVLLLSMWLIGFAISVWLWIRSWLFVRAAVLKASPLYIDLPQNDVSVRVMSSPALLEPAVVGILRPILLLPDSVTNRMAPDQLKAILVHELCHVRRRDNLTTSFYMIAETVFWFYPLVRWIGNRLIEERERACDEDVLRLGNEPLAYAEGILNVCKHFVESPLHSACGVTGSDLKERIRSILTGHVAKLNLAKKALLAVAGITALSIPLMIGMAHLSIASQTNQDISGTWQGTLGPRARRIVMKISREAAGLKVLLYSIDQSSAATPGGVATLQDSNFKVPFPGLNATYEGKVSSDWNSIAGTWAPAGVQPQPLNLTRATAATAWEIPEPLAPLKPMAPDANPAFEVASIKLSRPDDPRPPEIHTQPGRLFTINKSVMNIITYAYSINPGQVINAPDWLDTKYDIIGQSPNGAGQPSERQWKIMLQKLLADRFGLSIHRDKKELPTYALTAGKTAPKIAPSAGDPSGPPNLAMRARGRFAARNATMLDFAGELESWLDRPVTDQTGISGHYDFALNWTLDDFQALRFNGFPSPQQSNAEVPDLFTAIQEQLGLKLESTRGTVEVLVIDSIRKPSEN